MKNSKFNSLYQETYGRFTQGNGFLVGDVVKLKSGYENAEGYKELGENIKQRLADIVKTKNNLRVGRLHSYDAGTRYSAEGASAGPARLADCYEETAPGMWRNLVTVPVACLEEVDTGMNLPPVPDNQKDTRDRVTMPEEADKAKEFKSKATNQETSTMKKQTHVEKGDYELATKNTKLAHSNKHNDALPPKVKGMQKAKNLSESYASMEDLYINILTEDVGAEGQSANGSLDGGDQLAGNPQVQSEEGDKFKIGGKTVTNTTGQIAEEVCPICGKDVCQCSEEAKVAEGKKPFLPGGDPKTTEIKASKHSHHGS